MSEAKAVVEGRSIRRSTHPRGILGDPLFRWAVALGALALVALIALIGYELSRASALSLQRFGAGFLFSSSWDPVAEEFGALPFVFGTLVTSLLAMLLAGPVGLAAAILLSELAPGWLRAPLSFLIELLAAIPSIVYGLWGFFVMVPWLRETVQPWLGERLGWLPLFSGPAYGVGLMAAGLLLAIMVLPTVTAVSREVMLAVPASQREAARALGATRWETVRLAVLPYARSGILGAMMLGLGRALGETMAVTMVIGNRPEVAASLFAPAYTMASVIANEFTEATSNLYLSALIEIGLILFAITLVLNAAARLLIWRASRILEGGIRD